MGVSGFVKMTPSRLLSGRVEQAGRLVILVISWLTGALLPLFSSELF